MYNSNMKPKNPARWLLLILLSIGLDGILFCIALILDVEFMPAEEYLFTILWLLFTPILISVMSTIGIVLCIMESKYDKIFYQQFLDNNPNTQCNSSQQFNTSVQYPKVTSRGFCVTCGYAVKDTDMFCPNCGNDCSCS